MKYALVVVALLASGADVNKKYEYDYTALKYAKQNEDDEIVQLLRGASKR